MGLEDVIEIVKRVIGMENLMRWVSEKLVTEYGVKDIEVKRLKDAVVLVVKADEKELNRIEVELRKAISGLGFGEKIEVKIKEGGK